jgi:hypothetical protein
MQVAQYTFQSPSSTPVQVGKLDPSSVQDDSSKSSEPPKSVLNESATKAASFEKTQVSDVKTTVAPYTLDTYA